MFLSNLLAGRGRRVSRRTRHSGRPSRRSLSPRVLRCERLEDRSLLSAGALDPTFGQGGLVIGTYAGSANEVAIQNDGKIVVAGNAGVLSFALARFNADGSLDPTFGSGGKVITDVTSGANDGAEAVAIQSDGKIVAAGWTETRSGALEFAVVRYNANGTLDKNFGKGGKVTTDVAPRSTDRGVSVAIQPDGKIVVVGQSAFSSAFGVVRYNANGTLDTTFGNRGKVITPLTPTGWGGPAHVAMQTVLEQGVPTTKIVVGGTWSIDQNTGPDFAVVRYNPNGSLDASFGQGGIAITFTPDQDAASDMVIQPDGKIVLAGTVSYATESDFRLIRYESNGGLDGSFGAAGIVTAGGLGVREGASGVVLQPDGRIVVSGSSKGTGSTDTALARFNTDGSLDASFGDGGIAVVPVSSARDAAGRVALQADGKIVTAGMASVNSSDAWVVARFTGDSPAGMQPSTAMERFQALTDAALGSLVAGQSKTASTVAAKTAVDSRTTSPSPATSSPVSAPAALTKSDTSSAGRRSPAARTLDEVLATLPVDDLKIEPTLWSLTTEATDS